MLDLMIVDDDKMVVNDLINLIDWKKNGFNIVAVASNGQQALDKFQRLKPDIVITDVVMPLMKGIELLRQIKEQSPGTLVIVISSYAEFTYVKDAMALGAFNYLLKDEISEESLSALLKKAREQFEAAATTVNPFSDEPAVSQDVSAAAHSKAYAYLVCEIDAPLPLAEIVSKEKGADPGFRKIEVQYLQEASGDQISVHSLFAQSNCRLLIELSVGHKNASVGQLRDSLHDFARHLQRVFRHRFGRSLSLFLLPDRMDSRAAKACYLQHEANLRNRFFLGPEQVIDLTDPRLAREGTFSGIDALQLSLLLERGDRDAVLALIGRHFEEVRLKRDYPGFLVILETLINVLDCQSRVLQRPLAPGIIAGQIGGSLYSLQQCQDWLTDEISRLTDDLAASNRVSRSVRKAILYIRANYADKSLGLQSVADHVGLSPTHLGFLFKKETGLTINHYITTVRIDNAIEILRSSDSKIYEIADRVGYQSSQYFSQVFMKHVGCLPKEYSRNTGQQAR